MEKDTILLNLETYNELRDFKKNIEEGKTFVVNYGYGYSSSFVGTDEALEEMSEVIQSKIADIDHLHCQINQLKNPIKEELTVKDIQAMGWFDLIKWKFRNI